MKPSLAEPRRGSTMSAILASLLIPIGIVLLLGLTVLLRPPWFAGLTSAFSGPEPHGFWFLSRTSGLVGFALLWLSTAFGLIVSNRLARLWPGGPAAVDFHEFTSLLGLGFVALHMAALLGDRYIGYSPLQLIVPFTNLAYRPVEVALGQVALFLAIPVTVTFYLRRQIGYGAFRLIHYASYAVFVLSLVHGLLAGSDTRNGAVLALYVTAGLSVAALTIVRLLRRSSPPRHSTRAPSPAAQSSPAAAPALPDATTPLWASRR